MKAVIQRVSHASVTVNQQVIGKIDKGLLVLIGFEAKESDEEYAWLIQKIINLRIFNDENGVMNLSCSDIQGSLLIVSQFTLHASTKKGNRPSYMAASPPDKAKEQYHHFLQLLKQATTLQVETGEFGADMKVELLNDGPVTIIIDTKNKQ